MVEIVNDDKKIISGHYTEKELELIETANAIVANGKGILAADESVGTIGKRFDKINVENNEENRRAYRDLLFTTEGLENYISGVILFKETLGHKTKDGTLLTDVLKKKGILLGIKVDAGTKNIEGTDNETYTDGINELDKICTEYYKQGCRFAKWRAVLKIGKDQPSEKAIKANADGLAQYAKKCQEHGLVPIVEPEVLVDGTHDIKECAEKSEIVFHQVYRSLKDYGVLLEGTLLKPNMITHGSESKDIASPKEIAFQTVRTLLRTMPGAVPGVTFLSGGQSEEDATLNLNEINKFEGLTKPWKLSFSYGRALQHTCLKEWQGKPENVEAAQKALIKRAQLNHFAALGQYKGEEGHGESLHVKNYVY